MNSTLGISPELQRWIDLICSRRNFLKLVSLTALASIPLIALQEGDLSKVFAAEGVDSSVLAASSQPTYTIQIVNGLVTATPATGSGLPKISNADAATVIKSAINSNMKILILAGTYVINSSITGGGSNVELYGQGDGTILKLGNGVNSSVISLSNASGWVIHDLQIDGNKLNQSQTAAPPGTSSNNPSYPALQCMGVSIWRGTNVTLANCYVHDCRCSGVNVSASSSCQVSGCTISNSDANGITIDNSGGGSGCTVQNNTVNGASDVGISGWTAVALTVKTNMVSNVNLGTSPYSENSQIGIMLEGSTGCNNCEFSGNTVQTCGVALYSSPHTGTNTNVLFNSNTVQNCGTGVYVNNTSNIVVSNNTLNGITNPTGEGIIINQYVTNVQVTSNQVSNVVSSMKNAIMTLISPTGTLTGNTIHTGGTLTAIFALHPAGWTINNNNIMN